MQLVSARITNYKSILDSTEFAIGELTCLVGKNESGKTAVLEALARLNSVDDVLDSFDEVTDYPRINLSGYSESDEFDNVLVTTWQLSESECTHINQILGVDVLASTEVRLSKGYDNKLHWEVSLNYPAATESLLAGADLSSADRKPLEGLTNTTQLIDALQALEPGSDKQTAFLASVQEAIPGGLSRTVRRYLTTRLPKFLYYSNYHVLPGRVSADQLLKFEASGELSQHRDLTVFVALLSMVGATPQSLTEVTNSEELISKLEGVENRIGKMIFEYWSQNRHLEIRFLLGEGKSDDPPPLNAGNVFQTRIRNKRHQATIGLDNRSVGFIWFFSFLVWFSEVKKRFGDNLILLLDEPGLSLHAKAQSDLLRYFREELVPHHQVIYSTHSPFMIDPKDLMSARTVEDCVGPGDEIIGTQVSGRSLSTDGDTLFPLQAALGYDLTQSLFVGEHSLLVEGPSDLLYLQWASHQLGAAGRSRLDDRWTIVPCGGLTKVPSFLALFGGNQLHVAVFVDYAKGDKRKVDDLRSSELLQSGHVFTPDMFLDGQPEADTEDLLGRAFYRSLIHAAYQLKGAKQLPKKQAKGSSQRVVKEVEDHFKTLGPDDPLFDHFFPSSFLIQHDLSAIGVSESDSVVALDNFEKLFEELNALLS